MDSVLHRVALINGDDARHAFTRIHDEARRKARSKACEPCAKRDEEGGHLEGLKHDMHHLLTVWPGIKRRLRDDDSLFLWRDAELVVEEMLPDLFHVIPVYHDAVLEWVLDLPV